MVLSLLRALGPVFRTSLHAARNADRVERAADDVIAHARQILHAAAADEHERVLLQVVADAGNVGRHLDAVRQPDARDFSQRRVRLLRGLSEDAHAHTALLRAVLQRGALRLADDLLPPGAHKLTDSRHTSPKTEKTPPFAAESANGCFRPKSSRGAWRLKTLQVSRDE